MLRLDSASRKGPLVIAHRGASGEAPENTLASFTLALEQGADLIETDVHLTADGVPVAIHDPTVDRTTDGHGLVLGMTLAQVKALDAGIRCSPRYSGERVLTLDELLDWVKGRAPVVLEIKHDGPYYRSEVVATVVDALRRHDMASSAIVISFDHAAMLEARGLCPELATGVLFACTPVNPASLAVEARAGALLPHLSNLTPRMIAQARSQGLAISPWVADSEDEMRWALSLGVDAVATNYPARLAALLSSEF